MIRFIHSSDLHLGKRFGQFSGDLPGRLREARHAVIGRLAAKAREHGAGTVLLAGDTFDTETPSPQVRRQALAEMASHAAIRWVILPGNHDSLQAAPLWQTLAGEKPQNVTLAVEAAPIEIAPGAVLLPAPCTTRRPGRDLTAWMDGAPTPEGAIRVGLAHGAVQSFSEEANADSILAPDRARRAGLDYLALGDWHGPVAIDPRTRYSGSPEPDRFKHERPGEALLVEIGGAGALPAVTPFVSAGFSWHTLDLHLLPGDDPAAALGARLPSPSERRQSLVRIAASGTASLAARTALASAVEDAEPDFAHLELDLEGLTTEHEVEDLDRIDRAGSLRDAAEALLAEAESADRSAEERDIARAALARLYSYSQGLQP